MEKKLEYVSVEKLHPHQDNPRMELGELEELAASIKEKGVLQNLTVVPYVSKTNPKFNGAGNYTVVIGHRRLAAAKLAGLTEVPCIISDMTYEEQLATMLLENMQRSDLTVIEQARGFQMMIDIGMTVDTISEKTGFSRTTVYRRLEIAKLDRTKLDEISGRQLSIMDFDKLSEIEDVDKRNEVLKDIGTNNFNNSVQREVKKQNIAKRLPLVKAFVKEIGAKKLQSSDRYSSKYESISSPIYFYDWDMESPLLKLKKGDKRQIYYYLDEDWGQLVFYVERPKAKPQKRPQAELDREKYIQDTRNALTQLSSDAYKLRREFIKNLTVSRNNLQKVLEGAVIANALLVISYVGTDSAKVYEAVGTTSTAMDRYEIVLKEIKSRGNAIYPEIIYAAFGDSEDKRYFAGYQREFPKYNKNFQLDSIYDWLVSLGYELSDEEKMLRDGSHPLYKDKDAGKEAG